MEGCATSRLSLPPQSPLPPASVFASRRLGSSSASSAAMTASRPASSASACAQPSTLG